MIFFFLSTILYFVLSGTKLGIDDEELTNTHQTCENSVKTISNGYAGPLEELLNTGLEESEGTYFSMKLDVEKLKTYRLGTCDYNLLRVGDDHYFIGGVEFNSVPILPTSHPNTGVRGVFDSFSILQEKNFLYWKHFIDWLIELQNDVQSYLEEQGMLYTVVGGDLIGLCRSNKPLFWDDDIDLQIENEDFETLSELVRKGKTPIFVETHGGRIQESEILEINGREYFISGVCLGRCNEYRFITFQPVVDTWEERFNSIGQPEIFETFHPDMKGKRVPFLDIFKCSKMKCIEKDENGDFIITQDFYENSEMNHTEFAALKKRRREFHARKLYCDSDGYVCGQTSNRTGRDNWFHSTDKWFVNGYGPFPEHTKDDFPEMDFCGRKLRFPKIFFEDRKKACEDWLAKQQYGPDALVRVRKEVPRSVGSTYAEVYGGSTWQYLRYKGHDQVYIPVEMRVEESEKKTSEVQNNFEFEEFLESFEVKDEEELEEEELDEEQEDEVIVYDKDLNICVFIMSTSVKRERIQSFGMRFPSSSFQHVLFYDISYIYAENDDYQIDNPPEFLLEEPIEYNSTLKKVIRAFQIFGERKGDKKCDYIVKMDDDATPNWSSISYYLTKNNASKEVWTGRLMDKIYVQLESEEKGNKWLDPGYMEYTGYENYLPFQYGPFWILHGTPFDCFYEDMMERIANETSSDHQGMRFVDLIMEDSAVGILSYSCSDTEFANIEHMSFGEIGVFQLSKYEEPSSMMYLHMNYETRPTYEPLNEVMFESLQDVEKIDDEKNNLSDDEDCTIDTITTTTARTSYHVCGLGSVKESRREMYEDVIVSFIDGRNNFPVDFNFSIRYIYTDEEKEDEEENLSGYYHQNLETSIFMPIEDLLEDIDILLDDYYVYRNNVEFLKIQYGFSRLLEIDQEETNACDFFFYFQQECSNIDFLLFSYLLNDFFLNNGRREETELWLDHVSEGIFFGYSRRLLQSLMSKIESEKDKKERDGERGSNLLFVKKEEIYYDAFSNFSRECVKEMKEKEGIDVKWKNVSPMILDLMLQVEMTVQEAREQELNAFGTLVVRYLMRGRENKKGSFADLYKLGNIERQH